MLGALVLAALISPLGHVTDTASMLSPAAIAQLEQELRSFEQETGAEIAIATIPALPTGHTIETYAVELFEEWGIGKEKEDNGLLLLIARDDREVRIEVGYGLEGAVPDIEAGRIITEVLAPAFRSGNYDEGVVAAAERLMNDVRNGAPPAPARKPPVNVGDFLPLVFFFFIFLSSVLARSKSWWAGGVVGAALGWIFFSSLILVALLAVVGLIFDYLVSKTYRHHKNNGTMPPWWIGGPPRGRGGFGGFGGGMSGGGGASGRW